MERLRTLIRLNAHLLGEQPVIEELIAVLDDDQAERMANVLVALIRVLSGDELVQQETRTLH